MSGRKKHHHVTEATKRQIERRLESHPEVSYATIAGEFHVSRRTVMRIAKQQHRPVRSRTVIRCPGCGGLLRKKTACRKCAGDAAVATRRLARRRMLTASTL